MFALIWSPNTLDTTLGGRMRGGRGVPHTLTIFLYFFTAVIKHSRLGNVKRNEVYTTHFWRLKVQGKVELTKQERPD